MNPKKTKLKGLPGLMGRDAMKKIKGGQGKDPVPGCQTEWQECSSATHLNCCSGLVCASNVCQTPTL